MKFDQLPIEFIQALPVLKKLEYAGFEAYFVGGSVRDILLGKQIHDVDIATSAYPEEVKQLFPHTVDIGIEHGTVLVLENHEPYEITTFRTESTYQDYRRPDTVEFVRSLKEDLRRRDFTINAFAMKEDGEIVDLFQGLKDLDQRVLRAVGNPNERFHEDALRMMRGIRFVAQLGFTLEKATFQAMIDNHHLLGKISIERINIEFVKMMLGKKRGQGIKTLLATSCFKYCPELVNYEKELYEMASLPNIPIPTEAQMWALCMLQFEISNDKIAAFLKKWKCSNQMIKKVQQLVKGLHHRKKQPFNPLTLYAIGLENALLVEALMPLLEMTTDYAMIYQLDAQLPIHTMQELAVDGTLLIQSIGIPAGKWVSDTLSSLVEATIVGSIPNEREALLIEAKRLVIDQQDTEI